MIFMSIPWVISGAVIIENIFVIPGMGKMLTEAILAQDFTVVQASVLLIAVLTVVSNLICDVLTAILDPRIRISMGEDLA
ncbi:MAG: ABC transporter permease subunit, partial [Saccharofermentanales bacterium]